MGDADKTEWTNGKLLPFLNSAYEELQQEMELNNYHILRTTSTEFLVPIGALTLNVPSDFVYLIELEEKTPNTQDLYVTITEKAWEPRQKPGQCLVYYSFREGVFNFIGATTDRLVRVRYLKLLPELTLSPVEVVPIPNCKKYLSHKTAYLASAMQAQQKTRAEYNNAEAEKALERMHGLNAKMKQSTPTRMLPATRTFERSM